MNIKSHLKNQKLINQFGYKCIDALKSKLELHETKNGINLIKVFFHELVCLYTSTYITVITKKTSHEKSLLPYINSCFINDPNQFHIKEKSQNLVNPFYFLLKINFWSKKKIWIGSTLRYEEKLILLKKFLKYKIIVVKEQKIDLEQDIIKSFYKTIFDLSTELSLPLTKNHHEKINLYFDQFFHKKNYTKKGILFTGTTTKIQSRILSALFIKNNQKVVSFGHGETSITAYEEPVFEYGELWYPTSFVDFGITPISQKTNKIFKRTSDRIKELNDKKTKSKKNGKYLYVPTSMSNYKHYAPYRNFYDELYSCWQKLLFETLKNNGIDYMLKSHPKTISDYKYIEENKIEKRPLDWCFEQYEVLIFDYVSTALIESLATYNNIIFFDLGNRKISKEGISKIKNDLAYKKIDFNKDIASQITSALELKKNRDFSFINTFSINGQSTKEIINQHLRFN